MPAPHNGSLHPRRRLRVSVNISIGARTGTRRPRSTLPLVTGVRWAGKTPLHVAVRKGHIEVSRLLLVHSAGVNAKENSYLGTPLYGAAWAGRTDVAKLLLEHGADAAAANVARMMPLHATSLYGHVDVVRLLLDRGG